MTYQETLKQRIAENGFAYTPEFMDLIQSTEDEDLARELLVADDERDILQTHSDFSIQATLATRCLLANGLIEKAEGKIKPTLLLRAMARVTIGIKTIETLCETANLNPHPLIEEVRGNRLLQTHVLLMGWFLRV